MTSPSTTIFVFDLDATITECEILPRLAVPLGLEKEMSALTARTVSGQIAFEPSLRQRFDILKALPLETIHALVRDIPLQADIAAFIKSVPDRCAIITGNIGVWMEPLARYLGCRIMASRADYSVRPPALREITDKANAVRTLREEYRSTGEHTRIIAVGDGAGDIPMFREADTCIAYAGVHPLPASLTAVADYIVKDGPALVRLLASLLPPGAQSAKS